jgi:hypothetical protein
MLCATDGVVKENYKVERCYLFPCSDFSSLPWKSIVETIMPGQMPVAAAKINEIAGIYRSQCAVPNPVSHIPAQIVEPDTTKKNLMALLILYLLIISSFSVAVTFRK